MLQIILFAIFRYLHLLAAIIGVGGTVMLKYVVVPTLAEEEEAVRDRFHGRARSRLAWLILGALGVLIISGAVNLIRAFIVPPAPPVAYHIIFTIKFLLVLPLFGVAAMLLTPSTTPNVFQRNRARWLAFNAHLGFLIVALSVALRFLSGK